MSYFIQALKSKITEPLAQGEAGGKEQLFALIVLSASCLIDISDKVDGLTEKVNGNGHPGLIDEMESVKRELASVLPFITSCRTRKSDNSEDSFSKMTRWFIDKVLPSLIVSLITAATVFTVLVANHVNFGKP